MLDACVLQLLFEFRVWFCWFIICYVLLVFTIMRLVTNAGADFYKSWNYKNRSEGFPRTAYFVPGRVGMGVGGGLRVVGVGDVAPPFVVCTL